MSEFTNRSNVNHTNWYDFSALAQWLWILRRQLQLPTRSNLGFTAPSGEAGQPLARMLERHAAQYGESPPSELDKITDIAGYLKGAYKAVFRGAPLGAWEALLSTPPRDILPFTRHEARVMSSLSRFWRLLQSDDRRIRLEAAEDFVPFLVEALGGHVVKKEYSANELIHIVRFDAVTLEIRDLPLLVSFVFDSKGSSAKAKRWTEDLWQRLQTAGIGGEHLAITIPVGMGAEYGEYAGWAHNADWLICLGAEELKEIFTSERYAHRFQAILRAQLSLSKLNPYKWEGPVRPDMFHGREREIETILTGRFRDFLVIGTRQIGKSSLLTYLKNTLATSQSRRAVFLDCAGISSPDNFAERVASLVAPQRAHRMTIGRFSQMMRVARSTSDDPFLLLVDEADQLVEMAAGTDWRLLNILRELSSQGVCQTVLAGYKTLFSAWQDRRTPLFNFASPMHLSVLSRTSARQLVEAPLSQLEVEFQNNTLITQILDETGCHPSLLQFFCSSLIGILDERKQRTITSVELKAVRETSDYRDLVFKPFAEENPFTLLERWLVLALVRARRSSFDSDMVLAHFGQSRPWLRAADIASAFAGLELSGLIRRRSSEEMVSTTVGMEFEYVWTVPAFVVVAEKKANVGRLLQESERKLAT